MKRKIVIGFIIFIVLCGIVMLSISISPTKKLDDITINPATKPVIMITVDSLMSEPLQKAMKEGKAPAFSFLIKNGTYIEEVISSYPTMSVTIDSTILTGTYADQHKIPGLIWFNKDENRIVSYGSGFREIWNSGVKNVGADSIIHLNKNHLSKDVETVYEVLEKDNLQSASINGLLYRGNVSHQLTVPKLITLANLLPKKLEISGPTLISLGVLSHYNPENHFHKFIWNKMGVNDHFTVNELSYLIKHNKLPAFTFAYLPDLDKRVHKHGPDDLKGIENVDQSLQEILNNYSSWDEAIQELTWIILGDSGQSPVKKKQDSALIDLNELMKDYTNWEKENTDAQLAFAINERMAYISINDQQLEMFDIVDKLKSDERIGFIAWKDGETNHVVSSQSSEELIFSKNGSYNDEYKQLWDIEGDITILDLTVTEEGLIQYNSYPDALARLYGALHSQEGRIIVVDAKPSYEFIDEHSKDHAGGGAHGSLHKVDSSVPLIITGIDELPEHNRLIDIKEWILEIVSGS